MSARSLTCALAMFAAVLALPHRAVAQQQQPNVPRAVTEEELRALFTPERGWRILVARPAEFRNRVQSAPAIAACIERVATDPASPGRSGYMPADTP